MKARRSWTFAVLLLLAASSFGQQKTEITVSLNEAFFDTLIDAIYQNSPPPQFPLSQLPSPADPNSARSFGPSAGTECAQSVTILRENKSVRTAVRLRDGKITAPVAFTGTYSAPLIGCIDVSGSADSTIDLEFDASNQKLYGRVKVNNVNLNGTGGIGGSIVARMVQGSIDKKLNPIEIMDMSKLNFPFSLPNWAKLRIKAVSERHEVVPGALNVFVTLEIQKD